MSVVWHRRKRSEARQDSDDLCSEAEAVVRGTYAQHLESLGRTVPSWAWINALAHGSEGELSALAGAGDLSGRRGSGGAEWGGAVSFLAADLSTLASLGNRGVTALQREVLVPLELDLARDVRRRRLGPADVVSVALAALHGHPSTGA